MHFIAVPIPADLHRRADELIEDVRTSTERQQHVPDLVDLISELMEAGLESCFMEPLKDAGVGFVGRSTARVGLTSAKKGVTVVVRRILSGMTKDQLLYVAEFIDGMLVQRSGDDGSSPA